MLDKKYLTVDWNNHYNCVKLKKELGLKSMNEVVKYLLDQNKKIKELEKEIEKMKISNNRSYEGIETGKACPNCGSELLEDSYGTVWCDNDNCTDKFEKYCSEVAWDTSNSVLNKLEDVEYCENCGKAVKDSGRNNNQGNGLTCSYCGNLYCFDCMITSNLGVHCKKCTKEYNGIPE